MQCFTILLATLDTDVNTHVHRFNNFVTGDDLTKDFFFSFLQDYFVHEQSMPLKVWTDAKTCVHIFELILKLEVS